MIAFAIAAAVIEAEPVTTAAAACEIVKQRHSARYNYPVSAISACDIIPAARSPHGYYVLALHSTRKCEGICSTNMGWFAVQQSTGRMFDWDIAEWRLGGPFKSRP